MLLRLDSKFRNFLQLTIKYKYILTFNYRMKETIQKETPQKEMPQKENNANSKCFLEIICLNEISLCSVQFREANNSIFLTCDFLKFYLPYGHDYR